MSLKDQRVELKTATSVIPKANTRVTREEIELLREKTIQLVVDNPQKAAAILSNWLENAKSADKKKYNKKTA
jgi:hypothetical protein